MSIASEMQRLKKNLNRIAGAKVVVQSVWAKVKTVDWEKKTMVATGVVDDLDYYNVLLGLTHEVTIEGDGHTMTGNRVIKPKIGSLCLLGIIENHPSFTHLKKATEVEEEVIVIGEKYSLSAKNLYLDAESTVFNGGDNGGVPIVANIEGNHDKISAYIKSLETATLVAIGSLEALLGPPGTLTGPFNTSMALVNMNFENMENPAVKH